MSLAENLGEHLKRQLIFLKNSAALYDEGCLEEAIRIGVVLRVLCHDSNHSISLLTKMGEKDTLRLVTSAKTVSNDLLLDIDFGELMAGMNFGHTLEYSALPEDAPIISCHEWWDQPVFFRDKTLYTRKDVVLSAANKDGGAHVDIPDDKLWALKEAFWVRSVNYADSRNNLEPFVNNHYRMLRRFAEELLSSTELLELAY